MAPSSGAKSREKRQCVDSNTTSVGARIGCRNVTPALINQLTRRSKLVLPAPYAPASATLRVSPIVMMDATALARAIASKQVSCVDVMAAYLDHIDALNPRVNAIV